MTSAWLQVLTVAASAAAGSVPVIGTVLTYRANRRSQYERILAETAKLTTGEIALARDQVGTAMHGRTPARRLAPAEIESFYQVLWTFERLDGLLASLRTPFTRTRHLNGPQRLLLISIRGALLTWIEYVINPPVAANTGKTLDVSNSRTGLDDLYQNLKRLPVVNQIVEETKALG